MFDDQARSPPSCLPQIFGSIHPARQHSGYLIMVIGVKPVHIVQKPEPKKKKLLAIPTNSMAAKKKKAIEFDCPNQTPRSDVVLDPDSTPIPSNGTDKEPTRSSVTRHAVYSARAGLFRVRWI